LKWDLEGIDEVVSSAPQISQSEGLREKIWAMIALTDTTVETVTRIAADLRPRALDDLGLIEAIQSHARQFQARSGILVECDWVLNSVELDREQSTAVFRIFQETLTNILRHAEATRVDVIMKQEEDRLVLTISDDGKGITEAEKAAPQSLGLLGMRERVRLIGGELHIEGTEGQGTVITVWVPIHSSHRE
jgi:signal transduction histidine kinase